MVSYARMDERRQPARTSVSAAGQLKCLPPMGLGHITGNSSSSKIQVRSKIEMSVNVKSCQASRKEVAVLSLLRSPSVISWKTFDNGSSCEIISHGGIYWQLTNRAILIPICFRSCSWLLIRLLVYAKTESNVARIFCPTY